MPSCWKELGIPPHSDADRIRSAYRSLMLQFHPDRAKTPEEVRKWTLRCFRINAAYAEAQKKTRHTRVEPRPSPGFQHPRSEPHSSRANPATPKEVHATPRWASALSMVVGIVTLIGVMAGVTALFVAIDWTNTLPPHHPAAVVASTIALLGGALIIGYVVVGLLDAIVFYLLNDLVFSRLNMAAFENKIAWVAIVITNILLATYGPFSISVSGSGSPGLWFHDPLFRVLIGALVPATLAWDWVTTWFRFRKVQKGGLTLPNEKSFYEDKKV